MTTEAMLMLAGKFIAALVAAIVAFVSIRKSIFTVHAQSAALIERFGKFVRTGSAGLNFKIPWAERIRQFVDLKVQQHNVPVDTITSDKVSVRLVVAVQYSVITGREAESFYKLSNPKGQIESYVFDVVRARVPQLELDKVFDSKFTIADAVRSELEHDMRDFGYEIVKALVIEIAPDATVVKAMNEINAAQREREAANARGEAEKILQVKRAEAQAEADRLRGVGIANQRTAIAEGLRKSVADFKGAVPQASDEQVMAMLMMTQYLEMMEKIGAQSKSSVVLFPHSPGGATTFFQEVLKAVVGAASLPSAAPKSNHDATLA